MKESDNIISNLRLYLSAQTPANGERKNVGRNPHIMDIVIIIPDLVSSVMYQVIAYCTSEEPNRDIVWLAKKSTVFFFQFINPVTLPF